MSKNTKNEGEKPSNDNQNSKKGEISVKRLEMELTKAFDFRNNIILNKIEYKYLCDLEYEPVNINSIYRYLHLNSIPIGLSKLKTILGSDFVVEYNPIIDYFTKIAPIYDEDVHEDYIHKFLSYCDVEDLDLFVRTFKVWMTNTIKTIFEEKSINKTIYVLFNATQNSGKTTFVRFVFPDDLREYTFENQLDDTKDGKITLTKAAFHILDEMVALSQMGMESFKAMISKDKIDLRPPYGINNISKSRITSFIGTSDRFGFLKEDVGTARFIVQEVKKIDFNYSKDINPDILWSQAYQYYKNKEYLSFLSDDSKTVQENNKRFIRTSFISEAISEIIIPSNKEEGVFMQANEIVLKLKMNNHHLSISDRKIGDALNFIGFERVRHYNSERKMTLTGYYVKFINS